MASIVYNSALFDMVTGAVDCDTDSFKVLLVGATYDAIADETKKDSHLKRSDLSDEITGTGYTAGGNTATVSVTKDTANNRVDITLGGTTWPTSTITNANGAVYYKSRGGAATADELIAYIDFGGNVSSAGGTFTLNASTLRLSN